LKEQDDFVATSPSNDGVDVEYLPCVANFDSYRDEQGKAVRYLVSVDYFGPEGTFKTPTSLLPFFDEETGDAEDDGDSDGRERPVFRGVSGAAVGSGIDDEEDAEKIRIFLKTLSAGIDIPVQCIRPSEGYATMQEELDAYKALSAEEKADALRRRTAGPGKMALFVYDFAHAVIRDALRGKESTMSSEGKPDSNDAKASGAAQREEGGKDKEAAEESGPGLSTIDPYKTRFSCRKCRTILFGEDDLQDPPHIPSQHKFSHRKHLVSGSPSAGSSDLCQSLFLQEILSWMGDDGSEEGKFGCPACNTKLGHWHWSGTQCSCGTWVVPAIQIPKSRVDLLSPFLQDELPPGAVISPMLQQPSKAKLS
jgi:hypothetical protein